MFEPSHPRSPNRIDAHIGKRLRACRKRMRLSQTAVGEAVGVTFQQLQKYEKGENRIPAARLYALARFLDVPLDYFFEGLGDD